MKLFYNIVIFLFISLAALSADNKAVTEKAIEVYTIFKSSISDIIINEKTDYYIYLDDELIVNKRVNIVAVKGKKYLVKVSYSNKDDYFVYDGTKSYIVAKYIGVQVMEDFSDFEYTANLVWGDLIPLKISNYQGLEAINEIECHKYSLKVKYNDTVTVWLDTENYLPVKTQYRSSKNEMAVLYSDFRKLIKGIKLPYRKDIFDNKKKVATTIVESVRFNLGIRDEYFDPWNIDYEK